MKDMWIIRFIFIYFKVMYNIYYHNIWAPHSLCCIFTFPLSDPIISIVQLSNQISQQPREDLPCFYAIYRTSLRHSALVRMACTQEGKSGIARRCLSCSWVLSPPGTACLPLPLRGTGQLDSREDSAKCHELGETKGNLGGLHTIRQDASSRPWKQCTLQLSCR